MGDVPDLTVCVASRNTRIATEVCLRSLLATTEESFHLQIGDCASTDGSLEFLQNLARSRVLDLEVAADRKHGQWVNHWRHILRTRWLLFVDSDVEFHRMGWLTQLLATASDSGSAIVTAGWCPPGEYTQPATGQRLEVLARPEMYILLLDHEKTSVIDEGFMPRKPSKNVVYDTGAKFAEVVTERGMSISTMPEDFRPFYTHYGAVSWRLDPNRLPRARIERAKVRYQQAKIILHLHRRVSYWRSQLSRWPDPASRRPSS